MNNDERTFFTPCRSLGLKRKSLNYSTLSKRNKSFENLSSDNGVKLMNVPKLIDKRVSESTINKSEYNNGNVSNEKARNSPIYRHFCKNKRKNTFETAKFSRENQKKKETDTINMINKRMLVTSTNSSISLSKEEACRIKERILKKRNRLENLQMETRNVKQHDLTELMLLIEKWTQSCQQALLDLLSELKNRKLDCSMYDLLQSLGIPSNLVTFSVEDTDFY